MIQRSSVGLIALAVAALAAGRAPAAATASDPAQEKVMAQELERLGLDAQAQSRVMEQTRLAVEEGASFHEARMVAKKSLQWGGEEAALQALKSYRELIAEGMDDHEASRAVLRVVHREHVQAARRTGDPSQDRPRDRDRERLREQLDERAEEARLERERERAREQRERQEQRHEERRDRGDLQEDRGGIPGGEGSGPGNTDGGSGSSGGNGDPGRRGQN